jgi:hypothetical protein
MVAERHALDFMRLGAEDIPRVLHREDVQHREFARASVHSEQLPLFVHVCQ